MRMRNLSHNFINQCLLVLVLIFFSCKSENNIVKQATLQEKPIYDKLFEDSENILKTGLFRDKKWVNVIYSKGKNKFKLENIANVTFIKDSIIVETSNAVLYKFDKETGEIKWITQLDHPYKNPKLFYDTELEKNISQYEKLVDYYTFCISNIQQCIEEQQKKKQKEDEVGKEKIINVGLQKKIFESRKFDLEQKLLNIKNGFLIYTLRDLKLIGIDFYSGTVKLTKFLPSLPATYPFFFNEYITYFSSDRNRFVWVDPFEFTEEFQIPLDSNPNFVKEVGEHILTQDSKSIKYFDNNKIYWSIELNSNIVDATDLTNNWAFLVTDDNELIFISLITGRIEWKALLKFQATKLLKYAGYLFIKGQNFYQLVNLKTINKLITKPGSYYKLETKKTIRNVKKFCFGNKDSLYFLDNNNKILKFRTSDLENLESFSEFYEFIFIWEFGTNNVLLFKKPSSLYYFTLSE